MHRMDPSYLHRKDTSLARVATSAASPRRNPACMRHGSVGSTEATADFLLFGTYGIKAVLETRGLQGPRETSALIEPARNSHGHEDPDFTTPPHSRPCT